MDIRVGPLSTFPLKPFSLGTKKDTCVNSVDPDKTARNEPVSSAHALFANLFSTFD